MTDLRVHLEPRSAVPARLRGGQLVLARAAWVLVAILVGIMFAASVPVRHAQLQQLCAGPECVDGQLTPELLRTLMELGISAGFFAWYNIAHDIIFALVSSLVSAVIFWRRSEERVALFVAFMLVTFGAVTFANTRSMVIDAYPAWWLPATCLDFMGQLSIALFFYIFPDGRFVPRWSRWLAVVWGGWNFGGLFFSASVFNDSRWPDWLASGWWAGFLATMIYAQTYRYRRTSDWAQRQQTKWVVFSVTTALMGFLAVIAPSDYIEETSVLAIFGVNTMMYLFMLLIPLSIATAVLRYRLWDIDPIINRALVYTVLSALLAGIYFLSVVLLQALLRSFAGENNQLVTVVSTLLIVALFQPLRRRIQASIDRRFYRRKYDSAKTLQAFNARVRDQVELSALTDDVLDVVQDTLEPAHVSLWLRPTGRTTRLASEQLGFERE